MLNPSISAQPKPLRFKNYDDLKKHAEIDTKMRAQLREYDLKKCYMNLLGMELQARSRRQQGDDEESFILYHRALEFYKIVNEKMDAKFRWSENGRKFYEISNNVFLVMALLIENLKKRYDDNAMIENVTTHNVQPTSVNGENYNISHCIKPIELVKIIEKEKFAVLLIDYRKDQNCFIKFKSSVGSIDIIHLDPSNIVLGSLLHSLTKTLDISVRPFMEKISQYDLVVLLGDSNDITKPTGSILYAALTTHNRNKLMRPPVILENGFESWKYAYPHYTASKCEVQQFEETFDMQFTNWIEKSKKANKLTVTYPDLFAEIANYLPSDTINTNRTFDGHLTYELQNDKKSEPVYVGKINRPKLPHADDESIESIQPFKQSKIKEETRTIPNIDRSKKPIVNGLGKIKMDETVPESRRDIFNDHLDYKVTNADYQLIFPAKIQTIGGAQICNTDASRREASITPAMIQPRKPPTLDRSTKKNLPRRSQQTDQLVHFFNSYMMAYQKIGEDSAYKRMETKPGYTGLVNMGNTCFMSATLQALFHTPGFSQLFMNKNIAKFINPNNSLGTKGIISGCFAALIDLAWSGKFFSLRPYFFLEMFAQRVNSTLANRQQHDAQEFQIYLLDALHEDSNKVDKRRPFEQNYNGSNLSKSAEDFIKQSSLFSSSPVNDIFNLITISILQCKICNCQSVCFESLNQISVELPERDSIVSVRDCLSTHFSSTLLDALWDCPRCKCRRNATRTTKIWRAPKILIIHLKRFSYNFGHFVKNEMDVNFDAENLNLAPYIHINAHQTQLRAKYNLYAVTNHSGTLNSGHYTSYVKNQQEWLYFDDENCSKRNPSTISKQAFILYYALDIETGHGKNMI